MKGGFIGAIAGAARVGVTAARIGSTAARVGSTAARAGRAGSVAGRAGATGTRTFSAAGRTLSKPTTSGFKPPSTPAKPPSAPTKPPSAPAKPPSAQPTGQSGYSGSSYADHFGTATSFAPGYGQQGSYSPMGLASTGMGLATTGMGLAGTSIGAFTQAASEGTSQEALGEASRRGTEKGEKAADIVASGLEKLTSKSENTIISGKTSGPVIKHHKNRCPCPSNIRKYSRVQQGLPKGLQTLIAQYYTVASRCKCQGDNEELGKYLLKKILKSKDLLMSSGQPFSRTALYKHIAKEATTPATGGTRKKIRSVIHKKSKQHQQSRRRTRKN